MIAHHVLRHDHEQPPRSAQSIVGFGQTKLRPGQYPSRQTPSSSSWADVGVDAVAVLGVLLGGDVHPGEAVCRAPDRNPARRPRPTGCGPRQGVRLMIRRRRGACGRRAGVDLLSWAISPGLCSHGLHVREQHCEAGLGAERGWRRPKWGAGVRVPDLGPGQVGRDLDATHAYLAGATASA